MVWAGAGPPTPQGDLRREARFGVSAQGAGIFFGNRLQKAPPFAERLFGGSHAGWPGGWVWVGCGRVQVCRLGQPARPPPHATQPCTPPSCATRTASTRTPHCCSVRGSASASSARPRDFSKVPGDHPFPITVGPDPPKMTPRSWGESWTKAQRSTFTAGCPGLFVGVFPPEQVLPQPCPCQTAVPSRPPGPRQTPGCARLRVREAPNQRRFTAAIQTAIRQRHPDGPGPLACLATPPAYEAAVYGARRPAFPAWGQRLASVKDALPTQPGR